MQETAYQARPACKMITMATKALNSLSPRSRRTPRAAAALIVAATALGLASCAGGDGSSGSEGGTHGPEGAKELAADSRELVADETGNGVATTQAFFDSAAEVFVAGEDRNAQASAADAAVAAGAPMLVVRGEGSDAAAVAEEIQRLGAETVHDYGAGLSEEDLGEGVSIEVTEDFETQAADAQDPFGELKRIAGLDSDYDVPAAALISAQTAEDAGASALAATARSAGADVLGVPVADPRATSESMQALEDGAVVGLGKDFDSQDEFDASAELAAAGELPGGGGLLFPGRRMVALYGHPSGGALGLMGEQPPAEAVDRVQKLVHEYQPHTDYPVMPAFEIIATVASSEPGPDGDFSNEADPEELIPYIDAITEAGGYAFLDLQPGRANLLDQAKLYEDLLKRPNVGLALDPEWKIGPDEQPMGRVGHVEAHEITEVGDWLAELARDNELPQKGLIVHQFQLQMIRDRETINTDHPELSFILHADGHGGPDQKFDTWNTMQQGLSDDYFMAWKNFIDEDTPTFTPEQTYDIEPRPWFVSYQ